MKPSSFSDMTSVRRLLALAVVVAFGAVLPANGAEPARPAFTDREADCLQATPAQLSPAVGPGSDSPAVVNVLVLYDGLPLGEAKTVMASAAKPYTQAGLKVTPTFRKVAFKSEGKRGNRDTGEGQRLIDAAKALYKGSRPKGVDVVYVLTAKDLFDEDGSARDYSLAGLADCIGGVRYPEHAFAVGEHRASSSFYGLRLPPEFSASVAAHEVGHLFGAHHHYSTCTRPAAPVAAGIDVCTVMFPDIGLAGLEFSPVNAAVVRGHAESYARP